MSNATSPLDDAAKTALVAAIAAAERGHRGEIRVHLEARYPGDGPIGRAAALFGALGMRQTTEDTGVLLYVAWRDQRAAVWAGEGVHGAAAPGTWKAVTAAVARGAANGTLGAGLIDAVTQIGATLCALVPGEDHAGDELPNTISEGV